MFPEARFDIFSGSPDKDAMWIEAVSGLAKARERMEELAQQVPGRYFVFATHSRSLLAKIDTTKNFIRADVCRKVKGLA